MTDRPGDLEDDVLDMEALEPKTDGEVLRVVARELRFVRRDVGLVKKAQHAFTSACDAKRAICRGNGGCGFWRSSFGRMWIGLGVLALLILLTGANTGRAAEVLIGIFTKVFLR